MNDLNRLYDRIASGLSVVKSSDVFYVIRDPRLEDRQLGNIIYEEELDRLIKSGIPSNIKLTSFLYEQGLWSNDNDLDILFIDKQITKLQDEALDCIFKSKKRNQLLMRIKNLRIKKNFLEKRKNNLYHQSAEYLAVLQKNKYYLFNLTFDLNNNRIWTDWTSFLREIDNKFIHNLLNESYFTEMATEENIRLLARSEPWRSVWTSAIKTGNLFDKPVSDMTELQRMLVSWTLLYDTVYEHPERPDDLVIENPDLLDAWFRKQKLKTRSDNNNKYKYKGNEVGIIVDSKEDVERVYNMNSSVSNQIIDDREKAISKEGSLKEAELPDQKQYLLLQKNQLVNKR